MKRFTATAILGLMFILCSSSIVAAPVDLSIGGTAWYIWWKPAWTDGRATTTGLAPDLGLFLEDSHDFKPSSNVMAGPIISIGFLERWSIQSVFTIGRFKYTARGNSVDGQLNATGGGIAPGYKKYTRDILKWDSDTSIGCAVHRMVKIFAGFKHQGYRYKEKLKDILLNSDPAYFGRVLTDDVKAYGGGLGLSLTIPVVTDFYIMMSASCVVLWSRETVSIDRIKTYIYSSTGGIFPLYIIPDTGRYLSYGGTASLSFAYNIEKINTMLSLGGRYQLLYNRQRYNNIFFNDASMNIIDGQYDHFFGITLSAIYTFHLGKKA